MPSVLLHRDQVPTDACWDTNPPMVAQASRALAAAVVDEQRLSVG